MGISPPKVRLCGLKRNSSSGAGRNTRGVKEVQSEKDWSAPSLQSESQQVGDAHRKQEVSKETQGRTEAMGPEPRFGEEKRGHPLEMAFEGKQGGVPRTRSYGQRQLKNGPMVLGSRRS